MSGSREVKLVFRFVGDGVLPETITTSLGLTPTEAHAKGQPRTGNIPQLWHTGYWAIQSSVDSAAPLEQHLEALLGIMEPLGQRIAALRASDVTPSLFGGVFLGPDASAALVLSPELMGRMARLQLRLEVQLYVDD